jgi:hypothetical protein
VGSLESLLGIVKVNVGLPEQVTPFWLEQGAEACVKL